jgi:hypothetical protein
VRGRSKSDLPLSFTLLAFALLLSSCNANPLLSRSEIANRVATPANWSPAEITTDTFRLRFYTPRKQGKNPKLTIYLEGDGLAWIDRTHPSSDPTPTDPISLRLAVAQTSGPVAYIARPCQYTLALDRQRCTQKFWTYARYSEPIVSAVSQGIDYLKGQFGAKDINLVGYSGGGVIAALIAARRDDVSLLVTVAANLDLDYWTRLHKTSPLFESLNPADKKPELRRQRQIHIVGIDDEIVPPEVARSYAMKIDQSLLGTIKYIKNADHDCCWADLWPDIIRDVIR